MCISEGIAKGMQGVIFGSGVPQYAIVGTIYTRLYRLRMLEISNFGRYWKKWGFREINALPAQLFLNPMGNYNRIE